MSLSSKIAWNTLVQIIGKTISTALGVVITFMMTHYLTHADYGIYIFALVFTAMFGTLADWGLSLITIREASKRPQEAREIIGNVLVIRLLLALGAAIIAVLLISLSNYDSTTKVITSIAAIYLLALSLKTSFQLIFQVKLQMANWAISEIAANVLTVILLGLFIMAKADLVLIMFAFLAGDFLAAGVAAMLGYRLLPLKFSLVHQATKFMLAEALPMGAILVVFTIYNRIDTVILSFYKGADAVADYGLAYRIFEVVVLGAAYFANSLLPIISSLADKDRAKLGVLFRKAYVVLFFLGVGAMICTWILAPVAVGILGGSSYSGAVLNLRLLSLALGVSYFNHLGGYTLIALGKQWSSFKIAIIALVANVSLNFLLIPIFAAPGAAINTFLTEGLIVILSLVVIKRTLKVSPQFSDIFSVSKEFIEKRGHIFNA